MSNYKVPQLNSFEWQQLVLDKDLSTPSGLTPSKGNRYIVKATGSGDWTGHSNAIATYNGATWDFTEAVEGMICWIADEDKFYKFITSWTEYLGQQGNQGDQGNQGNQGNQGDQGSSNSYSTTFVNADLATGILTVTHNLGVKVVPVIVCNNNFKVIIPDEITYSSTTICLVDLSSYGVLSGTWSIIVLDGGASNINTPVTIQDTDGDTKVETEKNADEDKVRITTAGVQRGQFDSNGLTLQSGVAVKEISNDGTMAGNSDDAVPTEKAVKTYTDDKTVYKGRTDGSTPAAGYIGEMLSGQCGPTTTNTSGYTDLVTLTLTAGIWLVSMCGQTDNVGSQTGFDTTFIVSGTGGTTQGVDVFYVRHTAGQGHSFAFAPRRIVIATGTADKTVVLQGKSVTAAGLMTGYVTAIRIA